MALVGICLYANGVFVLLNPCVWKSSRNPSYASQSMPIWQSVLLFRVQCYSLLLFLIIKSFSFSVHFPFVKCEIYLLLMLLTQLHWLLTVTLVYLCLQWNVSIFASTVLMYKCEVLVLYFKCFHFRPLYISEGNTALFTKIWWVVID